VPPWAQLADLTVALPAKEGVMGVRVGVNIVTGSWRHNKNEARIRRISSSS